MGALLYRASRDGWNSQSHFHPRCDDKGATLTVIRDTKGHIFGGYTEQSWRHSGSYKTDDKAWLFWVKCVEGLPPTKTRVKTGDHASFGGQAVYCHKSRGPCFGNGHDIYLGKDMHRGYINWGHSYSLPKDSLSTFLTGIGGGHRYQMANEVEVYQVV